MVENEPHGEARGTVSMVAVNSCALRDGEPASVDARIQGNFTVTFGEQLDPQAHDGDMADVYRVEYKFTDAVIIPKQCVVTWAPTGKRRLKKVNRETGESK